MQAEGKAEQGDRRSMEVHCTKGDTPRRVSSWGRLRDLEPRKTKGRAGGFSKAGLSKREGGQLASQKRNKRSDLDAVDIRERAKARKGLG